MYRRIAVAGSVVVLLAGTSASWSGPEAVRLTPHRVVYDLALIKGGGSRGMENAQGRIVFDFTGDACEGYALNYRQVTVLEGGETGTRTSDLRTTTFESGDGKALQFRTDSRMEGTARGAVDGRAELRPGGLSIALKQPKPETLSFAAEPLFPTAHMKRLIAAARAGETTVTVKVFDGSDDGRKVYDTLAVIGRRIEPGQGDNLEPAAKQDGLLRLPRWPVTLSYFAPGEGERTPIYTIAFELYENGVSRALRLDYGDFALRGDLQTLQLQAESACQR
jgi:EipB-like